jgi:hypothetical protein
MVGRVGERADQVVGVAQRDRQIVRVRDRGDLVAAVQVERPGIAIAVGEGGLVAVTVELIFV